MRGCLAVILLLVVLASGMFLPRFLIGESAARYAGDRNMVACAALEESDVRFAWPRSWLVTADRVTSAEICPKYVRRYDDVLAEYSADVQLYTVFGLPHGELRIRCGASSIPFVPAGRANRALHEALDV